MKHLLLTTIAAVVLVGCRNPDGALIQATYDGNIAAVKQALNDGADVEAKDDDGDTPLHVAALNGYKEVAEILIAKSADVNAMSRGGRTPLHIAAWLGHRETVKTLIAGGADANAKGDDGKTPLDIYWDKETATLLRKHGGKTGAELKVEGK